MKNTTSRIAIRTNFNPLDNSIFNVFLRNFFVNGKSNNAMIINENPEIKYFSDIEDIPAKPKKNPKIQLKTNQNVILLTS